MNRSIECRSPTGKEARVNGSDAEIASCMQITNSPSNGNLVLRLNPAAVFFGLLGSAFALAIGLYLIIGGFGESMTWTYLICGTVFSLMAVAYLYSVVRTIRITFYDEAFVEVNWLGRAIPRTYSEILYIDGEPENAIHIHLKDGSRVNIHESLLCFETSPVIAKQKVLKKLEASCSAAITHDRDSMEAIEPEIK